VAGQPSLDGGRLVFLDETGSNVAMARAYARSKRGRPVYGAVPHNRGPNLTVVGAVSATGGLVAWRSMDGAMTAARFLAFVTEALIPALRPGDVVVMDNLSAHKTRAVRAALAEGGLGVVYLPRYSPEFNPIELAWARVKGRLRRVAARTREALRAAVAEALAGIGVEEVARWVLHCGYRLTSKPS
jgi:transposase